MPSDFVPEANKICVQAIGFNLCSGKVHDTKGRKEKKSTSWRPLIDQTPSGVAAIIELDFEVEKQLMTWRLNGKAIGESIITNYLFFKTFVAYVSMVHAGDIVTLNQREM